MAVVCHHTALYVEQQIGALPGAIARSLEYGYLGVDFFFVLSGFIIYYTNWPRTSVHGWPKRYAESRLTRIFVPYLPIGIAVTLVYTYLPHLSRGAQQWNWFSTITLLPSPAEPSLHVAWTLQHELIFYALAFLMLWSRKVLAGSLLWAALLVALLPMGFVFQPGVSPIDLEFLFGIGVAFAFMRQRGGPSVVLAAAGFGGVVGFFLIGDRYFSPLLGLGLALLLLPLVRLEAQGRLRVPQALVLLGNASYAVYLVHVPLLSVVVRLLYRVPPLWVLAVGIAASAAAGLAYHLFFEVPALRSVRNIVAAFGGRRRAGR